MSNEYTDMLTESLLEAAEELRTRHGWCVRDDGDTKKAAEKDGAFVSVIKDHLTWIVNDAVMLLMLEAKAVTLRAEADALDKLVKGKLE